jgi:hypothetical protein
MDISTFDWTFPNVEESHQINILTMDVSNDLDWWSNLFDDNWLGSQDLSALIGKLNNMLSLAWEFCTWFYFLSFLWLQKGLQEHLAKRIIWIFIDLGVIFLLGVQFLGLLSKLIN